MRPAGSVGTGRGAGMPSSRQGKLNVRSSRYGQQGREMTTAPNHAALVGHRPSSARLLPQSRTIASERPYSSPTRKRSIWMVNLFFGAGAAPTGSLLDSVAVEFQRQGWQVEVLAGSVPYNAAAVEGQARFGQAIHRLGGSWSQTTGIAGRFVAWLIFWLGVARFVFSRPLPAKVLLMTTPPFLHLLFVARNWFIRRKAEIIFWNQDTYPDVLAAVGLVKPRSMVFRLLRWLQKCGVQRVEKVIVLDQAMAAIYQSYGAKAIRIIPNWETYHESKFPDGDLLRCVHEAKKRCRHLVLYAGNYGWGHDLGILFKYLLSKPEQRDFFFLFVGGGEKWAEIKALADDGAPDCVGVFPYVPKAQVTALIDLADIGLVALEKACVGLLSPSKIHGYLASGKPLLYIGPPGSNVADAITRYHCGWQIDEHDGPALERCLRDIAAGREDLTELSHHALRAVAEQYNEHAAVQNIFEFVTLQ